MAQAPRLYTIRAGVPFLDVLAAGMLHSYGDGLADALVLLPTRRACRALIHAFQRVSPQAALLLPRIAPIGDVDEDELSLAAGDETGLGPALDIPPATTPLRRHMLLTREILRHDADARQAPRPPAQAALLAAELARLLDQVEIEQLSFAALAELVPEDYAAHWQVTLDFLKLLTETWPVIEAAEGTIGPAARRNRLLAAQADAWRTDPPSYPVIAAGSTGSVPATAALLRNIAALPQGAVVLPGFDQEVIGQLSPEARAALAPSHPQFGMVRLLRQLRAAPDDVADWPAGPTPVMPAAPPARASLINRALAPAGTDDTAPEITPDSAPDTGPDSGPDTGPDSGPDPGPDIAPVEALSGVRRIDCPGPREEALVIALLLRETLETPGKTAALVTPDRALARRVAAELSRWEVKIDDSAGLPLMETPPGVYLRLIAALAADGMAPVQLLAALKHPLTACGMAPGAFRAAARALEIAVLRGPRPAPGIDGLRAALAQSGDAPGAARLLDALEAALTPLRGAMSDGAVQLPVADLLAAHIAGAEAMAASDTASGPDRLWAGEAGEAAALFVAELATAAAPDGGMPAMALGAWPAFFDAMMQGRVVRPSFGGHPRLGLWGLLEARLQQADLLILAGLNEGTWPADPGADPWLSRPMRAKFGLPAMERRIGLAAHDFVGGFCAPELVLTRAERVDGTPTVPSRWLQRLDNRIRRVADNADDTAFDAARQGYFSQATPWPQYQALLDQPEMRQQVRAPAPTPPLAARPRRLSVTEIETWMRDPYAIYAKHVLNLRALEAIDADPGAADRGNFIHGALDAFVKSHGMKLPEASPDASLDALLAEGRKAFAPIAARPALWAVWWPRFERIARWFIAHESARRGALGTIHAEVSGELTLDAPFGPFILRAKADRIDRRVEGGLEIIDYKTGAPPSQSEIEQGLAPQLPLEAAIALAGGFKRVPGEPVAALAIWQLSGGEPAGKVSPIRGDANALAEAALAGLGELVAAFDNPATPYRAVPDPARAPRFSDYDHLARTAEWSGSNRDS